MKLVVIESPYAGDIERNIEYAKKCMLDSIDRGEAPIASHLLYTQPDLLDDNDQADRECGIECGLAWARKADLAAFYVDLGWSRGMEEALQRLTRPRLGKLGQELPGIIVEVRRLKDFPDTPKP